jgi:hypothetical protein
MWPFAHIQVLYRRRYDYHQWQQLQVGAWQATFCDIDSQVLTRIH